MLYREHRDVNASTCRFDLSPFLVGYVSARRLTTFFVLVALRHE
jgi:hypothetical protein